MQRDYDLFERLENHSVTWRGTVHGLENARRKLEEVAQGTSNECFAIHLPTRQIVALLNPARVGRAKPVVFQIAYDEKRLHARAEVLRGEGYEAVSVLGNDAAKVVLVNSAQSCDFFIVGHAAPEQTRKEMVDWLKSKYPSVKVLALNSPEHQLDEADYNVTINGPHTWLPIIGEALGTGNG